MELKTIWTSTEGYKIEFKYRDAAPENNPDNIPITGVRSFCFYNDKLVVVSNTKGIWGPPGGRVEDGETYEEGSEREILEETNMKVLKQQCIGYQDIHNFSKNIVWRQVIMFCIVEPVGEFELDPDGDIYEIKLIEPNEYKKYFDWEETGRHLIKKSLEIYEQHKSKNQQIL